MLPRVFVLCAVLALTLAGCAKGAPTPSAASSPSTSRSVLAPVGTPTANPSRARPSASPGTTNCTYTTTSNPARPVDPPPADNVAATGTVTATFQTNQGPVTITMDRAKTPCTVNSFLSLVQQKFYDNTQCHRLSDSRGLFMLQCGDPTGTGRGGPGYTYADEIYPTDTYPAGTIAMANSGPDTNGSQFFFVYQDSNLPPRYTAFGKIDAAGLGVLNRIAVEGQNGKNPDGTGTPNNEARIVSVTLG